METEVVQRLKDGVHQKRGRCLHIVCRGHSMVVMVVLMKESENKVGKKRFQLKMI